MKDQDLPQNLQDQFTGTYTKYNCSWWWEIKSTKMNQCDQYERVPQIRNNEITINLRPYYETQATYSYCLKLEGKKVRVKIYRYSGNGMFFEYEGREHIYYGKQKINKVIKWMEENEKR